MMSIGKNLLLHVAPLLFLLGESTPLATPSWVALPHVERREFVSGAGVAAVTTSLAAPLDASLPAPGEIRTPASIESNPAIPVWPSWGGGRVVPVSLGGPSQDPFLLLAHHKHWFDPRDPLRKPFKAMGKTLGLPYVGDEGFPMHPHRGFDILTYVLDGSDGFMHRDSLGGSRTYRGGTAQWMRTGSGVLHEEFWETSPERRTKVELFQLWVNLPAVMKFDEPLVRYVGENTDEPWLESEVGNGDAGIGDGGIVAVRDIAGTLDRATVSVARPRPPLGILHARIDPGTTWSALAPRGHSAVLYVREGTALLPGKLTGPDQTVDQLHTATFASDGDRILVRNVSQKHVGWGGVEKTLDVLLLTGLPLREPVAQAGPIVMNTNRELNDAYRQLSDGTFLDRQIVLHQQQQTKGLSG